MKPNPFVLGCISLLAFVHAGIAQDAPILAEIRYNPKAGAGSFEIRWNAIPGKSYELLATFELGSPWSSLLPQPILATSVLQTYIDSPSANHRYYLIRRLVDSSEGDSARIILAPHRSTLVPGQTERFSATRPAGETLVWSVSTLAGGDAGTISDQGVFIAPDTIPDPPYVVVQVRGTRKPDLRSIGLVSIQSREERLLTREQAVEIVRGQVIPALSRPANAVALGMQEMLTSSDELRPAKALAATSTVGGSDGGRQEDVGVPDDAWFFLVDPTPERAWAHRVWYVYVDARNAAVSTRAQEWYPLLNGYPVWVSIQHRLSSPDLVYVGKEFADTAARDARAGAGKPALASLPLVPWDAIFTNSNTTCGCGVPRKYALVIADDSPSSDLGLLSAAANGLTGIFDQDTETRMLNGGQLMAETLAAAGFQVIRLFGASSTDRARINEEVLKFHALVRPCDVFVLYHTGHGNEEGIGRHNYALYERTLKWIHTANKYVIIDSCRSGGILRPLTGPRSVQAYVLTSSDADTDSNALFWAPVFDQARKRKPLAFSNALLLCAGASPSMTQLHACAIAKDSLVADPNPQFAVIGAGLDTDGDGVVDRIETSLGLNPADPDVDGDGACDGLELLPIPVAGSGVALSYQSPEISASPLPLSFVLGNYDAMVGLQSPGQPFNGGPAGADNPHGFGPNNGWFLVDGNLPAGLVMERRTGRISGVTAQEGIHAFTVRYTDAIGIATSRILRIGVLAPYETGRPKITVTTASDVNARDNDISLREAILIASGELPVAALRPDPDPNDGRPEGELRWIFGGVPGAASSDYIAGSPDPGIISLGSPLVVRGTNDFINVSATLRSSSTPVILVEGDRNLIRVGRTFEGEGTVLEIRGNHNSFGYVNKPGEGYPYRIQGAGKGDGVLVRGSHNWVGGFAILGFESAVKIAGSNNTLYGCRLSGNGNGVSLGSGAEGNQIRNCAIGYLHDEGDPKPGGNSGHGVLIEGGARNNQVVDCGIGGNAETGILIQGAGTRGNAILKGVVGSLQTWKYVAIGPNGRHGIVIRDGATHNSVAGMEINENVGQGLLVTGDGTAFNHLGLAHADGIILRSSIGSYDRIRIENGASSNVVSIDVKKCTGDAIVLHGARTVGNEVTTRPGGGVLVYPTRIAKTRGAAVRIGGGAKSNRVDSVRVHDSDLGIVIEGPGTDGNCVVETEGTRNLGPSILLTGGCRFNRIENPHGFEQGRGSDIVISGAGTSYNLITRADLRSFIPNDGYAIEIRDGAAWNSISDSSISNHRLGGIRITGANTASNQVQRTSVSGVTLLTDIAASGFGIVVDDGARHNHVTDCRLYSNGRSGILFRGEDTSRNKVIGTYFELNRQSAVLIENARDNLIGHSGASRNIFWRSVEAAIRISGPAASGNRVLGNTIGASGFFSNRSHGVLLDSGAHHNRIGGSRSRQPKFETIPEIPVPLREAAQALGNLISGNAGDGIRIEGSHSNRVAGNLIGFSDGNRIAPGNGGNGVAILGGSVGNCVGDCGDKPDFSNQINRNAGAGVLIAGASTFGNSVMRNSIFDNAGGLVLLRDRANHALPPPAVRIDPVAARVEGEADVAGWVEVYSTFVGDPGVFHLRAFVQKGGFVIDQLDPRSSINAVLVDSPRPIRLGDQFIGFTAAGTGDTTEFLVFVR